MNILSKIFSSITNGSTVNLDKNRIYHVTEDDSFVLNGYFCSNSAKIHENPTGLRKTAVYLKDKKDITINGNGATILVHGKMTPILLDRCENITINDLIIDYAVPTMSEFKILSNINGRCHIKINDDCIFKVENNILYWLGETGADGEPCWIDTAFQKGRYVKIFDPVTETSRDFNRKNLDFEFIEKIDERNLIVTLKDKNCYFPAGSIIQTRNITRDQVGSFFERCKNLKFENLRVKFMHGLGMVSQFCENVSFKSCDFTPEAGRTIASTADFFQFSGCKGDICIVNCRAAGAHDDYINVHGTHLRIVEENKNNKTITVRFIHPETWGFQAFEVGDEIEFIKWNTLIPYHKSTVKFYKKLNETDILLGLDENIGNIELNKDVVENISWTPNLTVENCEFGPTSGRGVLCTTRGKVTITNNRFRNLWGPALLIEDDCNFWFESGYTTDISFTNNYVERCELASMYPNGPVIRCTPKVMDENSKEYVHKSLKIEHNTFKLPVSGKHYFWFEYIENVSVNNNYFDAPLEIVEKSVGRIKQLNNCIKKEVD